MCRLRIFEIYWFFNAISGSLGFVRVRRTLNPNFEPFRTQALLPKSNYEPTRTLQNSRTPNPWTGFDLTLLLLSHETQSHWAYFLNPISGFHIWIKGEKILGFSKTNILDLVTKFRVFIILAGLKLALPISSFECKPYFLNHNFTQCESFL